jgi:CHAT domain-containing protein
MRPFVDRWLCHTRRQVYTASLIGIALSGGAIAVWRTLPSQEPGTDLKRAMQAMRHRIIAGRLSGFPHAPRRTPEEIRAAKAATEMPVQVVVAANKLIESLAGREDGASLRAVGVAHLVAGDFESGIAALENSAERHPTDARSWSDLAVAYQTAASRSSMPLLLADALGAAGRAVAEQPSLPEARFNQAVIFEELGMRTAAVRAYRSYLQVDAESSWAEEARARIREMKRPTLAEEWTRDRALLERAAVTGDVTTVRHLVAMYRQEARTWSETIYLTDWAEAFDRHDVETAATRLEIVTAIAKELMKLNGDTFVADALTAVRTVHHLKRHRLARAYLQYRAARLLYRDRKVEEALPGFIAAEENFAAVGSPMRFAAGYYRAMAHDDSGRTAAAVEMLDKLLRAVGSGHHALRAQILWAQGTTHTRRGLLHAALATQKESLTLFERLGEEKNSCAMLTNVAATLAVLGRRAEAWQLRVTTFARLSRLGDERELQSALEAAARTEAAEDRWETALPLLAESNATVLPNPIVHASTVLWHALAEQRLGRTTSRARLDAAMRAADAIPEGATRERARLDVKLVAAIFALTTDSRSALHLLDEYVAGADAHAHRLFLPEAHLLRARAWRTIGDDRRAEDDLREALRRLAGRETDPLEQRSTYFRTGDEATRELVDILVRRGDAAQAFAVLAEFRSRPYAGTLARNPYTPERFAIIVEYLVLRDRLLVFTAIGADVTVTAVNVRETELRKAAHRFIVGISRGDAVVEQRALWRWLVAPVFGSVGVGRLVILVPDPVLGRLPFSVLRDPTGHYLIEYAELAVAPASSLASVAPPRELKRIVAVGDPLLDRRMFDLPPLRYALHEAHRVAGRYPQFEVFTRADATAERTLAAASSADVLHFATHAVIVPRDPSASYLALAPSDTNSGALAVRDIQRETLHSKPLIVLAGCMTGAAVDSAPRATSLAQAFLSAGATDVVGTLWDLPDSAIARDMVVRFHEEIRRGAGPTTALRTVQLEMIRSSDLNRRQPLIWSSFQVYIAHHRAMPR